MTNTLLFNQDPLPGGVGPAPPPPPPEQRRQTLRPTKDTGARHEVDLETKRRRTFRPTDWTR